jgi:hypothetical protein
MGYEKFRFRLPEDLGFAGYSHLAGPYYRKDEWMLDTVLADAKQAKKTVAFSGDYTRVEVWQKDTKAA